MTRVLRSSSGRPESSFTVGFGTTLSDLANVLFPSDCRLCGDPLVRLDRVPVCEACRSRLKPIALAPLCTRCGDALSPESSRFALAMGVTECTMCRLAPPEFARAMAFAAYDDATRDLLHLLKFQRMPVIASSLLRNGMADTMLRLESEFAADALVIPVPLFGARARSRGYNQAELLAEAGTARLRKLRPAWKLELRRDLLERVRDTRSSFAMQPHVRRANLRGAFRVKDAKNSEALKGREVLLVDDILTTGATARECARVLRRAGAAKVCVATYARTFSEEAGPASVALWTGNPAHSASAPSSPNSIHPPA